MLSLSTLCISTIIIVHHIIYNICYDCTNKLHIIRMGFKIKESQYNIDTYGSLFWAHSTHSRYCICAIPVHPCHSYQLLYEPDPQEEFNQFLLTIIYQQKYWFLKQERQQRCIHIFFHMKFISIPIQMFINCVSLLSFSAHFHKYHCRLHCLFHQKNSLYIHSIS